MSRGSMILGVMAGLTVGAIAGILFAPDKGSATRKKIINKSEDYVDNLKEKINDLIHNGSNNKEKVKENVSPSV